MKLILSSDETTEICADQMGDAGANPLTCIDVFGHGQPVHFGGIWSFLDKESTRRIVACVNACHGIPLEVLEARYTNSEDVPNTAWAENDQPQQKDE